MHKTERILSDGNLLRTFVEIAAHQNLTLASKRLNRSQSAISVQLRRLEAELGHALFIREGRGMALTPHGEKLLPVARKAIAELATVKSLFNKPLRGKIRVGIPDDFDEGLLEHALAEFARTHPGVEVLAQSGCTAKFPEALETHSLDVAVLSGPNNNEGHVFLEQKTVWAAGDAFVPDDNQPIPLGVIDHGCWMGRMPQMMLQEAGRSFYVAYKCTGTMSLKAGIRAGLVVGVLFESNLEKGMKVLDEADGLPTLPASRRSIVIHPDAPANLAAAMSAAITKAV